MSFAEFPLTPELHRSIRDRGYDQPTPIQAGAIAIGLEKRDLVATAETGSGKTAAFLIPIIDRLQRGRITHLGALIIAPTRELAAQIGREFQLLARHTRLRAAVVVGGESEQRHLEELRKGVQVLIACPGRLIDYLERRLVKLDQLEMVVIDEADRLLDMGFLPQVRRIMRMAPQKRQTLMFSATMGPGASQMAREFLDHPQRVSVSEKAAPPASIRQTICPATLEQKGPMLLEILKRPDIESAIVFTRTRIRADRVARTLVRAGIRAVAIHGDRSQSQRYAALAGFRARKYRVLVATDVAARGLDIPDVSHVINFDLPEESDAYIHRIGRTARMGKAGEAISIVTPQERVALGQIERSLGTTLEREKVDGFEAPEITAARPLKVFSASRRGFRSPKARSRWA